MEIVVATDENYIMGNSLTNSLPWGHLPNDMIFFKELTQNHIVIMGRKTWDSLPEKQKPLKNRINIVVTRNEDFTLEDENCYVCYDKDSVLRTLNNIKDDKRVFIIGGEQIYNMFLEDVQIIHHNLIKVETEFDNEHSIFFPFENAKLKNIELVKIMEPDERNRYSLHIYKYT